MLAQHINIQRIAVSRYTRYSSGVRRLSRNRRKILLQRSTVEKSPEKSDLIDRKKEHTAVLEPAVVLRLVFAK